MVEHPARGAHNNLGATLEAANLRSKVLAAVNGQYMEVAELAGVGREGLCHLDGQLSCRSQYQDLGFSNVGVDAAQQRQGKGCGLAGTGLGNAQQVVTGQEGRDGLRLDGRRSFIANSGNGFQYSWIQPQFGKRQF